MSTAISTRDSIERLLADCSLERGRLLPEGDSRRTLRRRMFKGASLHFNEGTASVECLVRNLSGHGVMVELDPLNLLPDAFVFRLAGDDRLRQAELVWRQGEKAGIRFP
ncbi:hypothetical protein [Salaquimonas pukyongi]|uniref:hypothetical protein n=1 Tax=Salaquimonas pukyongi TaxID=2712698 RepID=UPI0012EB3BFC|nr:hypothetical protein [Salaquimonas pukyongi]